MKFAIARTSNMRSSERPHPKAEFRNGEWIVEIDTLEELMNLSESVYHEAGDIVLYSRASWSVGGGPGIEIYDDWRE